MDNLRISFLQSGGFITNYSCSSKCKHCLYNCSPSRNKSYADENTVRAMLEVVKRFGCNSLHIGGGEPFLRSHKLLKILTVFQKENVAVDYIETNSSWYQNHKEAKSLLKEIMHRGVNTLLISISPFHNEYIPFIKVKGVIKACKETGMNVFPWVMNFYNEIDTLGEELCHESSEYIKAFGNDYFKNIPGRYWIHFGGRAIETYSKVYPLKKTEEILSNIGCKELYDTSHFHIDLYGDYIPGLCTGLAIPANALGTEISEDRFPVLSILTREGIRGLLSFAKHAVKFKPNDEYLNKCHLCNHIRKVLFESSKSYRELQPEGYYM